jgi:acetyltransferase-like isoleucine patch superfamily enzyme
MGTLVIGDDVRILAISKEGIMFGKNVSIGPKSILQCTGILRNQGCGIVIGDNTGIGPMAYIGGQGGVRIGNDVIVGPGLRIFSENHNYTDADTIIRNQGERRACVRIGDNCWIGANVVITAGVEIGNGCVIGAGAVVTRSIEPNSVAVGNPARKIKSRTRNDQ